MKRGCWGLVDRGVCHARRCCAMQPGQGFKEYPLLLLLLCGVYQDAACCC
jgi:hypothetical protein